MTAKLLLPSKCQNSPGAITEGKVSHSMPNILVTTLGTTWQILPELVGFTNPDLIDVFCNHPRRDRIAQVRKEYDIKPVDEMWVISTRGDKIRQTVQNLLGWYDLLDEDRRPELRIWQVSGVEDLASERECALMSEAIFRVVLHASEQSDSGQLLLSLAGGRKTMSSDIQSAGALFGCHALLHVIENGRFTYRLGDMSRVRFSGPLPPELEDAVTPLVVGCYEPSPLLDPELSGTGTISGKRFPLEIPRNNTPLDLNVSGQVSLTGEIRGLLRKAGFLYCNYTNSMLRGEPTTNFLALYSLPKRLIDRLKSLHMGVDPAKKDMELAWLKKLPKADLHCHLGGVAGSGDLIEIAAANRGLVERYGRELSPQIDKWQTILHAGDLEEIQERFRPKEIRKAVPGVPEPACMAAFLLLFEHDPALLDRVIYGSFLEEERFYGLGFDAYEAIGDFQGSGLLQSEQSIRATCRILARKAAEHHVNYIELRCSPANYVKGGLDPARVARVIHEELAAAESLCHALIFIASRHGSFSRVWEHVELAERLFGEDGTGFPVLRGFDVAGNERVRSASALREAFMSMMEKCMHFTVHAGENEPVPSIWEAVYHLSAERIGHGLTLKDNPALMGKFRDRNIAIEMCPSSNFQIVGFRDNYLRQTLHLPVYPLQEYLRAGLRVTVNTDNPGISRTDFTSELHRAARMTRGGLSLWEILILIRNGFKASFADPQVKQELILQAESRVLSLLKEGLPGEE